MHSNQDLIRAIYNHPNGAAILDLECASGYCSKYALIEAFPEEKEFIETLK